MFKDLVNLSGNNIEVFLLHSMLNLNNKKTTCLYFRKIRLRNADINKSIVESAFSSKLTKF